MIATIFINFFAILFAYLARFRNKEHLLAISFVIFAIFLSIRYMWGNDMANYMDMFRYFNSFNNNIFDISTLDYREGKEYGWIILNILCKPIGFFGMQILLAAIQNFIIYKFIKENVSPSWYWLSVFIYGFNANFMVLSASMMRQFLSMVLFVVASRYIAQRKIIPYLTIILLASTFHQSALILLPVYFISYIKMEYQIKDIIYIAIFLILYYFLFGEIFSILFEKILSMDLFSHYEVYTGEELEIGSGLGLLFNCFMFCLSFFLLKKVPETNLRIVFILGVLFVLIVPFYGFAPLISRISFYFTIFTIVSYPMILKYIQNNNLLKYVILLLVIYINISSFFSFFYSDIWYNCYFEYHTIFEIPFWT